MKIWVTVLVIIALGASAWYFFRDGQVTEVPQEAVAIPAVKPAVTEPEPAPAPDQGPGLAMEKRELDVPELEEIPLPPLQDSDPLVKQTLSDLYGEAETVRYFVDEDIVARAVANIDALDSRQVPEQIQAIIGPQDAFIAVEDPNPPTVIRNEMGDMEPQFLSDPANENRYTPYVEMLDAVDTGTLLSLYRSHYPLFQDAFAQLGYPDGNFNDRLKSIIDELLATPEVNEPLRFVKPEAFYLFADEELEALPAGQKVMIRMGSNNAAKVKSKLAEIRDEL